MDENDRPLRLEDFLEEPDTNRTKRNYSQNDKNNVEKNQQEFGHKKRIKP